MNYTLQQKKFDKIKWRDSIESGWDRCGSYEFCGECRKEEPNPCARAATRYENGYVRVAVIHRHV